jgi:hypothetical protein
MIKDLSPESLYISLYVTGEMRLIYQNQKVSGLAAGECFPTTWSLYSHRNNGGIFTGHASCHLNTVSPLSSLRKVQDASIYKPSIHALFQTCKYETE